MCYSAQIWADYRKYQKTFGADLDIAAFVELYWARQNGAKVKTPKAMDDALLDSEAGELIHAFRGRQAMKLEQEVFVQTKRLNDAERTLKTKITKAATENARIATDKISKAKVALDDLRRTEFKDRDSRIFPGNYAPVLVMENGKRIVKPMRYQSRPAGKPAKNDILYPGTYNARRDSLGNYWKDLFGYSHGLVVASTFYENVEVNGKNQVLQFTPKDGGDMLVACLWSRWTDPAGKEPDLLSFAAITDEPEPEVAAAGHDRTIVNIKAEHVNAWLNPDSADLDALYAIFDDKQHPFYEHRLEKAA